MFASPLLKKQFRSRAVQASNPPDSDDHLRNVATRMARQNDIIIPMSMVQSFFELCACDLHGNVVSFQQFEGQVCLITNIATADDRSKEQLTQLNELISMFDGRLTILAFPCNQFGSEPWTNDEILISMRHLRPGGNFQPQFFVLSKCDVNGSKTDMVFEYLKLHLPLPDDDVSTLSPLNPACAISWSPVLRSDVGDNFEKFLITPLGEPYKRYTAKTPAAKLQRQLKNLMDIACFP